jgi:Uma2 family endonuclease
MKAVMAEVPQHVLAWRAETGADRWDEMWEGVLHMPPMPNRDHQDLEWSLETWLRAHWAIPRGNKVYHQINVASPGGWPNDYRIPDLVLLTPDRFGIDRNEYFEGPPAVVVEIRSRGDETMEKLPFYASIGVPEVWVIDRDSKSPQVYVLVSGKYELRSPDAEGWSASPITGVRFRGTPSGKLQIQLAGETATASELP